MTWWLGAYPDGEGDYPVRGVSWYEAAAYARYVGKELPTTAHWNATRRFSQEDNRITMPRSNQGDAPRPVGENRAMTTLGVYDLTGNVREWCWNGTGGDGRATRGGQVAPVALALEERIDDAGLVGGGLDGEVGPCPRSTRSTSWPACGPPSSC